MSATRPLSAKEAELLSKVLGAVPGGEPLADQIGRTVVRMDSSGTFLRLDVLGAPGAVVFRDGPVPGRFPVQHGGEILGELMIWLKDGRLSGLEYAWVTDTAPAGMPEPEDVVVESAGQGG